MKPSEFHALIEDKLFQIEAILRPLKMGHKLTLIARATKAPTGDGDIVLTVEPDIEVALEAARRIQARPDTVFTVPAKFSEREP